jgi:heme/copper-type cytochrome/quinol oxidase subunit 1
MRLNPPKKITFWISVLLGVLALVGAIVNIPFLSAYAFWVLFIGFLLLVLSLLIKGL